MSKQNDYINYETIQKQAQAETSQKAAPKPHSFQIRFFYKPILCNHCRDYIWGQGHIGFGCTSCSICIHSKCKIFTDATSECNPQRAHTSLEAITRSNLYPIENWSIDLVKQWLAVVNLHRYAQVFSTYNINGPKLLSLDIYQLYAIRIRDTYHHSAILQARDELLFKSKQNSDYHQLIRDQDQAKLHLEHNPFKADRHHFLLHTVSKLTDCEMCARPLLGIVHQGLLCQACGLIVHRQCSCIGLPECKPKNPQLLKSIKHQLFGVSLFDLCANEPNSSVPKLLIKAFKTIEDRAYINLEDLYDVYRLSADTSKIDEIKKQLNENGVELTQFDNYDLNTIAALVKHFLRDLQDSVIPEEMYSKLISEIQDCSSDQLRALVKDQLHPLHYACLSYIMAHLVRVWNYQFKIRGCHYLPDKLFHIFRSILIRPPWEKITEVVVNVDKQSLVVQRLLLECDWGVDLPEYKIRPKRTLHQSSVDSDHSVLSVGSLKSSRTALAPSRMESLPLAETNEALNEEQWFWGMISRDDTILILKSCPDGSFLVRNSSDKSAESPYTLCVMKGTFVKSIKIFRQELHDSASFTSYLYDIEKPCRFESVQALVSYYSRVSLKEYNHNLDLVLTYGVSKYKFGKTSEWSIDKLYSSFRDAFQSFEQKNKKFDGLESEIAGIREDLSQKRMANDAFDKVIKLFMEQVQQIDKAINQQLLKKTNAISSSRLLASQLLPVGFSSKQSSNFDVKEDEASAVENLLNENKARLKIRIDELLSKKEELNADIEYLNKIVHQLQEELDLMRPELIELRKKRENYHMWLLQRGENDDKIQTVLKSSEPSVFNLSETQATSIKSSSSMSNLDEFGYDNLSLNKSLDSSKKENEDSVHGNSLNWFIGDCAREKSIEILSSKPDGSYLVRPSSNPNSKYVLSLVYQGAVKHLLIDENQSGCFLKASLDQRKHKLAMDKEKSDSSESLMKGSASMSSIYSSDILNCSLGEDGLKELKFKTLTELIVYFSKNNVQTKNLCLNVMLLHPAFVEEFDLKTSI